tara:strand:+ start:275 stop:475 length:201 start_codon:yes stop_codon:yes gene_type:complete
MKDKPKAKEKEVERLAYSIDEAAKSIGVCRNTLKGYLAEDLRSFKKARRVLIPKQELIAFLERGMR